NEMATRLRDTGATILKPADLVCPQGSCAPLDASGRPIYKDSHHMRAFFIREKMDILDPVISR
ncbi:MAG: hypothetical protein RSB42_11930, partial [Comamonas sp.]